MTSMSESDGESSRATLVVRPSSLTHGFLFADLRGYTSYVDRRGAVAAAALLDRFRELVRGAVASHHGAETRTEGDSFYVVFPSARMAVDCALDIVRGAADEVLYPDDPIQVGVGVHAGEAVETPDGPVGTAVNIAARLCAMAGPGEVVVSDTVRALTRSVGTAGFVPMGRRPIKGLDEALTVYRAVPAGTADGRGRARARRPRIASIALISIVGGVALAVALLVAATLDPPCESSAPEFLGTEPKDVIDWLASRPWLDHTAPRPYNIGKYLGRSVDITVPSSDRWTCPATDDKNGASMFRLGSPSSTEQFGSVWGAEVGERKRVVAIDVEGRTVTLVIGSPYPDVAQLWTLGEPLLQTIEFTGSTP